MLKKILLFITIVSLIGCGKPKNQLPTIGVFQISSSELSDATREGFIQGMKDAGFQEGVNIHLDLQNAEGDIATAQLMVQKFVSDRVDIICAITTPCLQAALNATKDIPIVFGAIANPYKAGAGESATNHRANVTGASATSPVFETLELIKQTNPQIKRIGIIWNPSYANSKVNVDLTRESCQKLDFELVEVNVNSSAEVYQAAQTLVSKDIDLFFTVFDHSVLSALESVIKIADQHNLAVVSNDPKSIDRGVTLGLGWDYFQNGVETSKLVVRVLKGEKPSDIPFQGLKEQEMMLNLKKAKAYGLTFPDDILQKAQRIIQ